MTHTRQLPPADDGRRVCDGPRSAFTLLELMLVLAIIAMLGAIVAPSLGEVMERQKLRASANNLRLVWDTARLEAMRTGQAQVFTCTPGSGNYRVQPLVLQSDLENAGAGATLMTGAGTLVETANNGMLAAAPSPEEHLEQLEDKVTFVGCVVAGDMRAYTVAQASQTSGTGELNTQTVAQSVLFYPDGSTSTAEVRIQNERGDVRGVQIRGLTGHSRVVDISNVPSTIADQGG